MYLIHDKLHNVVGEVDQYSVDHIRMVGEGRIDIYRLFRNGYYQYDPISRDWVRAKKIINIE